MKYNTYRRKSALARPGPEPVLKGLPGQGRCQHSRCRKAPAFRRRMRRHLTHGRRACSNDLAAAVQNSVIHDSAAEQRGARIMKGSRCNSRGFSTPKAGRCLPLQARAWPVLDASGKRRRGGGSRRRCLPGPRWQSHSARARRPRLRWMTRHRAAAAGAAAAIAGTLARISPRCAAATSAFPWTGRIRAAQDLTGPSTCSWR